VQFLSGGKRVVLCVVCSAVIGSDLRRRYCGPICRVKVGRGGWLDRSLVERLRADHPVTAVHEAGHAVVGMAFGWGFPSIDVEITSSQLGMTEFEDHGGPNCGDDPLEVAAYALAGYVAQKEVAGEDGRAYVIELVARPGKPDPDAWAATRQAFEVAEDAAGVSVFIDRAADRAVVIVRERRADVELVAGALFKYGRLTPAAVAALLAPETP